MNSAINNGNSSLQLALLNKNSTPIWHFQQFKPRLVVIQAIRDMVYKGIKAFADVGNINKNITTIQPIWEEFSPLEIYKPTTLISCLRRSLHILFRRRSCGTRPSKLTNCFITPSWLSQSHHQKSSKRSGQRKETFFHPPQVVCGLLPTRY